MSLVPHPQMQNGFAMLFWFPLDTTVHKGGGASKPESGTRSFKCLGQKRPLEESAEPESEPDPSALPEVVIQSVKNFEEFLARAQFNLRSAPETGKAILRVPFTVCDRASPLNAECMPEVKSLKVLASAYTFELADTKDVALLHTRKGWKLELSGVREDAGWKYHANSHFKSNIGLVLYDQLQALTDEWLVANDDDHHPKRYSWSLDPGDDVFGITPAKSLQLGTFCDYEDRHCMRLVSISLTGTTPDGHAAHGLAAATATIGHVPLTRYRNQTEFPEKGYLYAAGFELPASAKVARELTSEQDCMLCSDTYTTRTRRGMRTPCGHYMCQTCWETPSYQQGIKEMQECGICRAPCALAPAPEPEPAPEPRVAGYYANSDTRVQYIPYAMVPSSNGGVEPVYIPRPAVGRPATPTPPFQYLTFLSAFLRQNGLQDSEVCETITDTLGIKRTEQLRFFTADDITGFFEAEISEKLLPLHKFVIEYVQPETIVISDDEIVISDSDDA